MFVYFIYNSLTHNFKIGKTKSIETRLKQLQTGNEIKLEVTRNIDNNNPEIEKYLHEYFKDRRLNGEWFNVSIEEIDYVINLVNNPNKKVTDTKDIKLLSRINKYKKKPTNITQVGIIPLHNFFLYLLLSWIILLIIKYYII
jgi:hypothetical protein